MSVSFLDGNEASAWGAIAAGCSFFAGYPITPATSIFNWMLKLLPSRGGICLQGEDEIASIGYCLGASMTGAKVMTATSGPGLSLMSEHISFAIGSEIPVVVIDVQRLGPSTGSPTLGADGDVNFLRWGSSGGLPVIVLAPSGAADCYFLTFVAFNLAEKYRCPVIIASNKEVGQTCESCELDRVELPERIDRKMHSGEKEFYPFAAHDDRSVPDFLPVGGKVPVRQTSSTHGPDGYITTDSKVIGAVRKRLARKIESHSERLSYYESFSVSESEVLLITYGVTAGAARDAVKRLKIRGIDVSLLILKTLWLVPEALIRKTARNCRRIIVLEMNLGQYVFEVQRLVPTKAVDFLGRMDGSLITPDEIVEAVRG